MPAYGVTPGPGAITMGRRTIAAWGGYDRDERRDARRPGRGGTQHALRGLPGTPGRVLLVRGHPSGALGTGRGLGAGVAAGVRRRGPRRPACAARVPAGPGRGARAVRRRLHGRRSPTAVGHRGFALRGGFTWTGRTGRAAPTRPCPARPRGNRAATTAVTGYCTSRPWESQARCRPAGGASASRPAGSGGADHQGRHPGEDLPTRIGTVRALTLPGSSDARTTARSHRGRAVRSGAVAGSRRRVVT